MGLGDGNAEQRLCSNDDHTYWQQLSEVLVADQLLKVGLQPLLYDLEAGMPFLFVDQLVVQAPDSSSESQKLRILLAVSGQWLGSK